MPGKSKYGLEDLGIKNAGSIFWNLNTPNLYEHIIKRGEGLVAHLGPIVVRTGSYTGRSPKDRFIVKEKISEEEIWWGKYNQPFEEEKFKFLFQRALAYIQGRDLYVQDCYAGNFEKFSVPIRVITEFAWHSLFARNIFVRPKWLNLTEHKPEFTVLHLPNFKANPEFDGTASEAFIILNFSEKLVLIGGTAYAGEIKKSIFSILNFLLPKKNVLSMHCSANKGENNDSALYFGLSGTGKTTLSSDPERFLIGDDEHGWCEEGIFNFEGGCYAKMIKLDKDKEPDIYQTTRRFGSLLENVSIDFETRRLDLNDDSLTENTRGAYPLTHIPKISKESINPPPKNIFFLTLDANGILPPIAKLTPEQAKYYFLLGYTSKVAGTEKGLGKAPQETFSPCFGAPFMTLKPVIYSRLLKENIEKNKTNCWIVNTGWVKGPFGKGERISIPYSRALIRYVLKEDFEENNFIEDSIFSFKIPKETKGIPEEILNPKKGWKNEKEYEMKAKELANRFKENFKEYEEDVSKKVRETIRI